MAAGSGGFWLGSASGHHWLCCTRPARAASRAATFLGRLLIRRETSFLSGGIVENASELVERGRKYVRGYE